jgi:Mrp family chromosome partitioning ATPase
MRALTGRRRGRRHESALRERLGEIGFDGIPRALTEPLRTMVARQELQTGAPLPRTTAVASVLPGEHADIVAHALSALVAHDYERRVCRVDGSWLTLPTGHDGHGASVLLDLIDDSAQMSDGLSTARGQPRLATLRAGQRDPDEPPLRVQVADIRRLIVRLSDEFDHIILEAPGLLANRDGETVVNECDGYVLVVRRGTSTEGQVHSAISLASSTMCLGAVLTDYDRRRPRGFNRRSRGANET